MAAPVPSSTPSSPPTQCMARCQQGSTGDREICRSKEEPRKMGWKGEPHREGGEKAQIPPTWPSPQIPRALPQTQPHYGVPAVGRSACAPADDLVDAFLMDGSVAFLRRRRPRRGWEGTGRAGSVSWPSPAPTQSHRSPNHPHPHPTQAWGPELYFSLLPALKGGAWEGWSREDRPVWWISEIRLEVLVSGAEGGRSEGHGVMQ